MLLWVKGPAWVGNRYDAQSNVGTVRNTGIEFTIGHRNQFGDFSYSVDGNVSFIKNELTALNGGAPVYGDRVISDEGLPLFTYWGYKYKGVYQSKEQADEYLWGYAKNGAANPYTAGDAIYEDINGDGIINDSDQTKLGNNFPKVTYGLNLGLEWKGIDVQMFFQGVAGNKIAYMAKQLILADVEGNFSRAKEILNAWSPENRASTIPILSRNDPNGNLQTPSSWYLEDGSYLRLKNLTVGYDFTNLLRKAPHFAERNSSLNVYFSAENLLTFTKYSGMDPEVGGYDTLTYPVHKIFAFGLKLNY
jgi:hypothetical protein